MDKVIKHIAKCPTKEAWNRIGIYHHHGINLPLFSLRSRKSCGIGEFLDLLPLIDWCSEIGFDVIQLLPLNDTGYETSPYNALSSLALNPIYLSLHALPYLDSDIELHTELILFEKYQKLQRVPYEAILNAKLAFLRRYFAKYFSYFAKGSEYEKFLIKNDWVRPYALFKVLKDTQIHQNWAKWPKKLQNPTGNYRRELEIHYQKEMDFYILLQFLSFKQLKEVNIHAHRKGVWIKGDIPILISPESSDVWLFREDFDRKYSAGAPPDMFTPEGQNWGFPIYQWDRIEENSYSWWHKRLRIASDLYDIYRVDHIIGFYRIWAMKQGQKATEGKYIPNKSWAMMIQGEQILSNLISFSPMLPIGEDLGVEIEKIRESLNEMGVPGTRIPRWEKRHKTDKSFIPYKEYNPLSLTSLSTHDSETLEQWWKEYPKDAKAFAQVNQIPYTPIFTRDLRYRLLSDSHKTPSLFHINLLSEYLALFPDLIWQNPDDERINLPGTIAPSNWCYRFRPYLEEITSHTDLKNTLQSLVEQTSPITPAK